MEFVSHLRAVDPDLGLHAVAFLLAALAARAYQRRHTEARAALWLLLGIQLALAARYLYWRGNYTLNYATPFDAAYSVTLFAAEIFGCISLVLFFMQSVAPMDRSATPIYTDPKEFPTVDVFVTIFNEPADILFRTLVAAKAIDYPAEKMVLWVLDDGARDEIFRLAGTMGVRYIARTDRQHAKAGNINHALPKTEGELILILDTDHIPTRSILKHMVGYFKDPKVGFVQSPHHFYNPDSFQRNLHLESDVVHEQDLFFQIIQSGRDTFNSSFFAGSSGVLRRSALEGIGGFQTDSLIEDMHTSMAIHSQGWRSVYVPYIQSGALSPESFIGYMKQRERWARGGAQVFAFDNPLFMDGLSFAQRLQYFGSVLWFFHSWPRVMFLLAPLPYLLAGHTPIIADIWSISAYFIPFYIAQTLAFGIVAREFRNPFWSDVYETATAFSLSWTALKTLLMPVGTLFHVTPKGRDNQPERAPWAEVLPHVLVLGVTAVGVISGVLMLYRNGGVGWNSTVLSLAWALFNCVLLSAAIHVARERHQERDSHRINRRIACEIHIGHHRIHGLTNDLSESGCSLVIPGHMHLPKKVSLLLISDYGERLELSAETMRATWRQDDHTSVGLRFVGVDAAAEEAIIRLTFSCYSAWDELKRPSTSFASSVGHMGKSAFRSVIKPPKAPDRRFPRLHAAFDVIVESGSRTLRGTTSDISATGVSLLVAELLAPAEDVKVSIIVSPELTVTLRGHVVRSRKGKSDNWCAVKLTEPDHLDLAVFEGGVRAAA